MNEEKNVVIEVDSVVGQPGWDSIQHSTKVAQIVYNPLHAVANNHATMCDVLPLMNKLCKTPWVGTVTASYIEGAIKTTYPGIYVISGDKEDFLQSLNILEKKLKSLVEIDVQQTFSIKIEITATLP